MSRIYVGGGGLALFVGAAFGLLVGKGSWVLAVIGLACFLWGITSFWAKYSAARNALLAQHTFYSLDNDDARSRVTAKARELSGLSALEMEATLSFAQLYGLYAFAMNTLGLEPALTGERWFAVGNPLRALQGADQEIASARRYFQKKYGLSLSLDKRF